MSEKEQSDGRQTGEFTEEEGKVHLAGFKIIHEGMARGLGFDDACSGLEVVEPGMRAVIIDDYLKVIIAEGHFQNRQPLEDVAAGLKIPLERVETVKEAMLLEVQKASAEVYRKEAGDAGFDMDAVGGEKKETDRDN